MTTTQFDALAKGDTLIRVSNGKRYVVSRADHRPGTDHVSVSARIVRARIVRNGQPYGRIYTVTLDAFTVAPQEVK